jgi:hypothetical protein
VQFVALSTDLIALRILLCPRGASCAEPKEHFFQRLAALALQWAWLGGRTNFSFFWASGFF